jgi:hypothetical protein
MAQRKKKVEVEVKVEKDGQKDWETTRLQDYKTTRLQDYKTTRLSFHLPAIMTALNLVNDNNYHLFIQIVRRNKLNFYFSPFK